MRIFTFLGCTLLATALFAAVPQPVTQDRALREAAEGANWLLNGGNFRGEHFSPLREINSENAEKLGLDWSTDLPAPDGIAAIPLVADGVIYLSAPFSIIFAIDAASGRMLWTHDPGAVVTDANDWTARVNRGVALWGDYVLITVSDCRLIALDRVSGETAWSQRTCDPEQGYSITDAPRVGGGRVFVGNAGSESGYKNRGFVSAYDAEDGRFLWRFYTVPSDRPEQNTTAAMKMAAATWSTEALQKYGGGGSAWNEMTYDPDSGLLYFGTAGTMPYVHEIRNPEGGDNLFTSSVVAVHADSGAYAWHYQTVPEDSWDYNANMNIVLADLQIAGKARKTLLVAPKNGFFYVLDRLSGELISANNYVRVNWATHVDMETGRPVLDPAGMYWKSPPGTTSLLWPNMWGAHSSQPMAWHPQLGLAYIPAIDIPQVITYLGDDKTRDNPAVLDEVDGKPHVPGKLIAWDPRTQSARWSADQALAFNGGVLATAGNLVFQGDAEGRFSARDAADGRLLWSADTGSAITAAPVSYLVNGKQRILVPVGAGSAMQFAYPSLHSGRDARGPSRLMSFSLEGRQDMPKIAPLVRDLPDPPNQQATAEMIQRGGELFSEYWCKGCHGKAAVARLGGSVPDLRYASNDTYLQWNGIVIGGARRSKGMPAFEMSTEEAEAIRAWVISRAQALAAGESE